MVTGSGAGLLTVGHGRLDRHGLGPLLRGAGVEAVVDVRRFPGSRSNPDVVREALARWLPDAGISYRWEQRLGGRRSLPAREPVLDTWWTVPAFRAYAAHTRTEEFRTALAGVLDACDGRAVAVLCSESVWWRCHRRLIADFVAVARRAGVRHLMHDGRLAEHRLGEGVRLREDGLLVYDAGPRPSG